MSCTLFVSKNDNLTIKLCLFSTAKDKITEDSLCEEEEETEHTVENSSGGQVARATGGAAQWDIFKGKPTNFHDNFQATMFWLII